MYKGCTAADETPHIFISKLADELVDFEQTTRYQRTSLSFSADVTTPRKCKDGVTHLTPTKKLKPKPTTPSGKENMG